MTFYYLVYLLAFAARKFKCFTLVTSMYNDYRLIRLDSLMELVKKNRWRRMTAILFMPRLD